MAKERGSNMDDQTRSTLDTIENRLEDLIRTLIAAGFKEVKDIISELFNKDIGYIKEWQDTFKGYHKEHYEEDKKIWKAIDALRSSMPTEIDRKIKSILDDIEMLKEKQIVADVSHDTADKIEEKGNRNKELSYGKVAGICAIVALVFSGLGYLFNLFI